MELFLAEQASFLQFDENSALPPSELQRVLNRIITINPHYSETVIFLCNRLMIKLISSKVFSFEMYVSFCSILLAI